MHQTRASISTQIPIPRKGTKYIARAKGNGADSVPVVVAIRDMLHIAKDAREVTHMIHTKALKINGRLVRDKREGIALFSILEADKKYKLTLLTTGKFVFTETKDNVRLGKVISKTTQKKGVTQITTHDGTSAIVKDNVKVGDSVEFGEENKVKKVISLDKGKEAMVISGRNKGHSGKISSREGNNVIIALKGRNVTLDQRHVMAI